MKNNKFKSNVIKTFAGLVLITNIAAPVVSLAANEDLLKKGLPKEEVVDKELEKALNTPIGEGMDKEMSEIGKEYNEESNFPDPSELIKELENLSEEEKKDSTGLGDFESSSAQEEINEKLQESLNKASMPQVYSFRAAAAPKYANVNNYIAQKKFANPIIQTDSRINTLPQINYYNGKPIGIVVHYTANRNSTIFGEVNFMYRNYPNAFVHAYVDKERVIQTANTNKLSWGAGPNANPYFMNVELCFEGTFDGFARSVNNNAYYMATLLKKHGLKPSYGENNGKGTILSHAAISKFYGGTNHTDPIDYFKEYGYSMSQYYDLIATKYAEITGAKPTPKPDPVPNDKITGDYHIVKKGETLYNISTRSGKSVENIKKWNNLKSNTIEINQKLWLKEQPKPSGITVKSDKPTTEWMTLVKDVDYAEKAEGLPGRVVKGNTKNLSGKNVKVTRVAQLSDNSWHKRISQNNNDLGWVKADSLVPTASLTFDTIKSTKKVEEWKTIKSDTPIWNKAEGLKDAKSTGNTKGLYSKDVKVTEVVVTSKNKEYKKITQSKVEVGWVLASSLVDIDGVKSTVDVKKWDKIKRNTPIYSDSKQSKVTGNTSSLKSKDIRVTKVATYKSGKKVIEIYQNNNPVGWILAEDTEKPNQY